MVPGCRLESPIEHGRKQCAFRPLNQGNGQRGLSSDQMATIQANRMAAMERKRTAEGLMARDR